MDNPIGRVIATEKKPTTVDEFAFWTDSNFILNPFDVIKIEHIKGSFSYGIIEDIKHITDANSFLTNYISSDFGDVNVVAPTLRVGMNYVEAKIIHNTEGIYIPVQSDKKVFLADKSEIEEALGLSNKNSTLPCGYLEMYENTDNKEVLLVRLDPRFIIGPEGAHLNISGISGLAAKTSYAMFLLKAIQDSYKEKEDDSVAFVLFNVKGKDLMGIDLPNDFEDDNEQQKIEKQYTDLGLTPKPFEQVKYLVPNGENGRTASNTHLSQEELDNYINVRKNTKQYAFTYEEDKSDLDLFFTNVNDDTQTIDAIQEYILNGQGGFNSVNDWQGFIEKIDKHCNAKTSPDSDKRIMVQSWWKFRRIIGKTIRHPLFQNSVRGNTTRIAEEIKKIQPNQTLVIDIANLSETLQSFVFGDA
ncbi:MAG: ATP-binding protein, partial [Oscillospiraceae bacterium]|nr:ATP-binding protein [Oscillospiraceae bacterium]